MPTLRTTIRPTVRTTARLVTGGLGGGGTLRLVSTRGSLGGTVLSTGKQQMTAIQVKICADVTSIQVVYGGERTSSLPSGITVKAAVWKDDELVGALAFGGNSTVTIAAAELATSDALAVSLSAGDTIEIRTLATVDSGTSMWCCQYLNGTLLDGIETGVTVTDKTASGTVTLAGADSAAERGYTPVGVIGMSSRPAVAVFGDSISTGTGDIVQIGYLGIAFERNLIPYMRVGTGGSTGAAGLTLTQNDAQIRAMAAYVQAASWEYGVNDISSSTSSATMRSTAESWATEFRTLVAGAKISISTILPVVASDNSAPANNGYWNSTKEAVRVTYNNSLRSGLPTGFNYLWEASGDASGASGLFRGAEATKDGGVFRADLSTENGFGAINDGLHPGRPLIIAAAGALDLTAFLGVSTLWGPEIAYATIPSSGMYAECVLIPSRYPVTETPGTLTGITIGGDAAVLMSKTNDRTARLYCYDRIGTGSKPIVVSANSTLVGSTAAKAVAVTVTPTNNSTWGGSTDPGTLVSSDVFTRADTSYDAAANNNTAGANWTDKSGNCSKIASNKLKLQGQNSRIVFWNAADYTDIAAEIEFDPADFTANSSDPFGFKLGVRINTTTGDGVYACVNRNADLAGYSRLELHYRSANDAFGALNNVAVTGNFANGTTYRLRIAVSGSGGSKTVIATLSNASTETSIATLTGSTSLAAYPDAAGKCGLVTVHTAANDAATATASEILVDNFAIRQLTDNTAPVLDSATLSDSGRYIDVAVTELGLPLLPTSAAAGFSVSTGTISETIVYGADNVRVVLASAGSLPLTLSYAQAAGNITDQTGNELTAFTDETVT